jgi:hypothetical protein
VSTLLLRLGISGIVGYWNNVCFRWANRAHLKLSFALVGEVGSHGRAINKDRFAGCNFDFQFFLFRFLLFKGHSFWAHMVFYLILWCMGKKLRGYVMCGAVRTDEASLDGFLTGFVQLVIHNRSLIDRNLF